MADDLASFAARMEKLSKNLNQAINLIVQDTAIATVAAVARATPVDVATARSNWIASLGGPNYAERAAFSPYPSRWRPIPGINPGGSQSETQNQAGAVWAATAAIKPRKPGGGDIYITNALPYIGRLNAGHSKRAPAGFVQKAMATATAQFETIAKNRLSKI